MKKLVLILLALVLVTGPMHLTNAYLRSDTFDTVTIRQGETIHELASRYTVKEKDRQELIEAICDVNDIHDTARLQAGRHLKVPVLPAGNAGVELAQR